MSDSRDIYRTEQGDPQAGGGDLAVRVCCQLLFDWWDKRTGEALHSITYINYHRHIQYIPVTVKNEIAYAHSKVKPQVGIYNACLAPKSSYSGSNFANVSDQFWLHFFRTHVHGHHAAHLFLVFFIQSLINTSPYPPTGTLLTSLKH